MANHTNMRTVQDTNFKGKKVLIRVDFNVPLNHNRQVTDDTRIRESLLTIKKILNDGASVILITRLRPVKEQMQDWFFLITRICMERSTDI